MAFTTLAFEHENQQYLIELPDDLPWADEFSFSSVVQTQEYSATGSLIIEHWEKKAGRPITLGGQNNIAWIDKVELQKLVFLNSLPNKEVTLTLSDSRIFQVMLDNSNRSGINSKTNPRDNLSYRRF